jgi:Uma2 family endonuclease
MALPKDTGERLITGEELFRSPNLGPCELVDGRIVPLRPTGRIHGRPEARLTSRLLNFVESHDKGEVLAGEIGIYVRRNPDTVRMADIVFISHSRMARCKAEGYLDVAPEIVVEALSPNDRQGDLAEKIQDYFSAGVDRVWVLDSRQRCISVYRSVSDVQELRPGDVLTEEDLLPGFRLAVGDLFDKLP